MSAVDVRDRFEATLAGLRARWPEGPLPGPPSPFVRAWVDAACRWAPPELAAPVVAFYGEGVPTAWARRFHDSPPAVRTMVRLDLRRAEVPRLRGAVARLFAGARAAGVRPWGLEDAEALLDRAPRVVDLHGLAFYGCSQPLVSLGEPEQRAYAADHDRGWPLDALLDARLASKITHELTHGEARPWAGGPGSWMLQEAAAAAVQLRCRWGHIVAEVPGEPVLGLNTAMLLGHAVRDDLGEAAVWRLALTSSRPTDGVGRRAGHALVAADWQTWAKRPLPNFLPPHAHMAGLAKLFDVARDDPGLLPLLDRLEDADEVTPALAASLPDLLAAADAIPWPRLRAWREREAILDVDRVGEAVRMLFQVERLQPDVQSCPADPPGGTLHLDVARCDLTVRLRRDEVHGFAPQARLPPPLVARLHGRGLRHLVLTGCRHEARDAVVGRLVDLLGGTGPLPATLELPVDAPRRDRARLDVRLPPVDSQLHHPDPVVAVGCCLARELAARLRAAGFAVQGAPEGLRHDPVSAVEALDRLLTERDPTERPTTWIVSWETAWREGELLTVEHLLTRVEGFLTRLRAREPRAHVVVAVSPVRLADAVESQRAKAALHLAATTLADREPGVTYLPAYELVLDGLRDHRWFGEDLRHLSPEADDRILALFVDAVVGPAGRRFLRDGRVTSPALPGAPQAPME